MQDGDLLPPYQQGLSTPFQTIPERVGLAASNWAYFAGQGINMLFPRGLPHVDRLTLLSANRIFNKRGQVTNVMATFNEVVDRPSASRARNYRLTFAGKDGKFGTRDDIGFFPSKKPVPSGATVRLTFVRTALLRLRKQEARLSVSGVKDLMGRPMIPTSVIVG